LVKSLDLSYEDTKFASLLTSVVQSGYVRQSDGLFLKKSLPAVEFEYSRSPLEQFDSDEFPIEDLPQSSLENLPSGVFESTFQWADLEGEGISGILVDDGQSLRYKSNLGCGQLGRLQQVLTKPTMAQLSSGQQKLMDLDGDGQLSIVNLADSTSGYFEREKNESWDSFHPFSKVPNLNWSDSTVEFADLNGDGFSDVVVRQAHQVTWYESLGFGGFDLGGHLKIETDEQQGPAVIHQAHNESVMFADMSGDGLSDIVRIRNGEVCYWPNLGYGKFGRRITMANSPVFDRDHLFAPQHISVADTDGSGITDIIYHSAVGASVYLNYSGNSWSEAKTIKSVPSANALSSLATVDLFGNGTICLVWSTASPSNNRHVMRYVDLMHGQKPYLLTSAKNNMGAETHVDYTSSTQYYLDDKANNTPWATKLPFPVHVVSRVETIDRVARNRFVSRYRYRHGYFDGVEREFRGFGFVEQWDTEEFGSFRDGGTVSNATLKCNSNISNESHVPPVITRTWFHTGAHFDHQSLLDAYEENYFDKRPYLEDSTTPEDLSVFEERPARTLGFIAGRYQPNP